MEFFKYETHIHTCQGSGCAVSSGAEMVDYYKSKGYSGFVVTDHFLNGNTAVNKNQSWEEMIEDFCLGYEDAKKRGDEVDFDVFLGLEYNFHGTEFLIYGLDKAWLKENKNILQIDLRSALRYFKNAGALVIHAHPFREAEYIDMIRLLPNFIDAAEIINRRNNNIMNDNAAVYADMYNITKTSGGDSHGVNEPTAGIKINKRAITIFDLIEMIKNRDFLIME